MSGLRGFDGEQVTRPAPEAKSAAAAKAEWVKRYLIGLGVPGLRSSKGTLRGVSGHDIYIAAGQPNVRHTGAIGGEMNLRARRSGLRPVLIRALPGMGPEQVLVVMRLSDWAVWLSELVKHDPARWVGNNDEEMI